MLWFTMILMFFFNFDLIFCMNLLLESDYFVGDLRLLQCNQCLFLFSLCMYKFWLSSLMLSILLRLLVLVLNVIVFPAVVLSCYYFVFFLVYFMVNVVNYV